jgi:glycerophosphoryl diester phosphodiesterase
MSKRPLVIAHRGASAGTTDNSLEAFARAIEVGADMIEFDVRRTSDDKLITLHDAEADGRPISSLTYERIARSLGYEPPLLDEVLELAGGRIGLDVELKEDGYVERVMSTVVAQVDPRDVLVTSFFDGVVAQVKRRHPDVMAGLLVGVESPKPYLRTRLSEASPVPRIRACGADLVAMHHQLARLGALRHAHSEGFPSIVWTVNDDRSLRRLLADERVYAVITDVPERAIALRAETMRS